MNRGIRNNNPLNIRYSPKNAWKGKVMPNTDGEFEQFSSMAYGFRAARKLIQRYIRDYRDNCPAAIIARWAPANENNTEQYIRDACRLSGLGGQQRIAWQDVETINRLMKAMAIIESGEEIRAHFDVL